MGLTNKRPLDGVKDSETREQIKEIQEEATGKVLELSAAPTASVPLIQDGERGVYSGVLYSRVSNTIYVFTPSSTISVTV